MLDRAPARPDIVRIPDRAVGKPDVEIAGAEAAAPCDTVFGARDAQDHVGIGDVAIIARLVLDDDIAGRDRRVEDDVVDLGTPLVDLILAESGREAVGVGSLVALHLVVAGAADEDVVAGGAVEDVVAGKAHDGGCDAVVGLELVPAAGPENVGALVALQVDAQPRRGERGHVVISPDRAVREMDLGGLVQPVQHDLVGAAVDRQHHARRVSISFESEMDIRSGNRRVELYDIGVVRIVRRDVNRVRAEPGREAIDVVTVSPVQLVMAGAADQDVGAVCTVQDIVARAADDGFVSGIAVDAVVEGGACQRLIGRVALDHAARQGRRGRNELVAGPDRPVIETDLVDTGVFIGIGAADRDGIVRVDGSQDQVAVLREVDGNVGDRDGRIEDDRVDRTGVTEIIDEIVAETAGEAIKVRAGIADQGIAACAAIEDVVTFRAPQEIVAGTAGQRIVAAAAIEGIVVGRAGQRVVRDGALHVDARRRHRCVDDVGQRPGRSIREADAGNALVRILAQGIADFDDVLGALHVHEQIVGEATALIPVVGTQQLDVGWRQAGIELDPVEPGVACVDPVVAKTRREPIDVGSSAAGQGVVAGPAAQDVRAVASVEAIVTRAAEQGIVGATAFEQVVFRRPAQRIRNRDIRRGDRSVVAVKVDGAGQHLLPVEHCAVGEADLLDRVEVGDRDPVVGAGEAQPGLTEIGIAVAVGRDVGFQHEIIDRERGIEHDDVVAAVRRRFLNRVLTEARGEPVGVRAGAASQRVVAGAAGQGVVIGAARQLVVAAATIQYGASRIGGRIEQFGSIGPDDAVGGCRTDLSEAAAVVGVRQREHVGIVERAAVGEAQLLDPAPVGVDISLDRDPVLGSDNGDDQILAVAGARQREVGGGDSGPEQNRVVAVVPVADDVLAVAPVEHIGVVAVAAAQPVVAGAADQDIVAVAAIEDRIVAGAARYRIGGLVAGKGVVAAGRCQRAVEQLRIAERAAVAEAHQFDPAPVGIDASLDGDPVFGSRDGNDEVLAAIALRHHHIRGRDAGAELDDVIPVIPVADDVLTITAIEDVGVVAVAAAQPIVTGPADQGIVAVAAIRDGVVADAARERVGKLVSGERVIADRRRQRPLDHLGIAERAAVGKAQLLYSSPVGIEAPLDRDPVVGPRDGDDEVLAVTALRHHDIGGRNAGTELDGVGPGTPIADNVLAVTAVEHIGVVAAATAQPVVAGPAGQNVVAVTGIREGVVAGPT